MTDEAYCFGDAYEVCGGESAIRVYSRSIVTLDAVLEYEFVGCYKDDEDDRIMIMDSKQDTMSAAVSNGAFL